MTPAGFVVPVGVLPALDPVHTPVAAAAAQVTAAPGFGQLVSDGLARVNGALLDAQVDMQQLAAGKADNLHQVMLRIEESRLQFQLVMQVRNRVLEAYQEVMRMQV